MGRKKKLENQPEVIIDAAWRLFGQYGFAKTTLDDIAKEVGIGKATLYSDFSSKEDILMCVIRRFQNQLLTAMENNVRKPKGTALSTIHNCLLKEYMLTHDNVRQHHSSYELFQVASRRLGKPYDDYLKELATKKRAMINTLLRKACENGEITPLPDYQRSTEMIFTGLEGVSSTQYQRTRAENQKLASDVLGAILNGLKTPVTL